MKSKITPKQVFVETVKLMGRMEQMKEQDKNTVTKFTRYVWLILVLTIVNLFVHLFLMLI